MSDDSTTQEQIVSTDAENVEAIAQSLEDIADKCAFTNDEEDCHTAAHLLRSQSTALDEQRRRLQQLRKEAWDVAAQMVTLRARAKQLVDEVDKSHEQRAPPFKYTVPWAAVVALRHALDNPSDTATLMASLESVTRDHPEGDV